MEKVLLLGANGKLGQMLQRAWGGSLDVVAITRADWQVGAAIPALPRVDAVVAAWGVTPGPGRDLAQNVVLARAAMELGLALGAARVLHFSSVAVYAPDDDLTEAQMPDPQNAYGVAKRDAEAVVRDWRVSHPEGPEACHLRIGNVVGADSLFAAIASGAVELDRFEDGSTPRRSYVAPGDLAQVCAAVIAQGGPEVLNVASDPPHEMGALARAAGITPDFRPAGPGAMPSVTMNTDLLQQICPLPRRDAPALIADWQRWGTA